MLLGLGLADLVHGGGEELDYMEPVHGHIGAGEALSDGGQEGWGHVADHLGDVLVIPTMLAQEMSELDQAVLAFAGGDEDHRLLLTVQVDEHGDVIMPALAGGFVQGHGLDPAEVQPGKGLGYIVMDHPPQALVADADDAGRGQHRHLPQQGHGRLLEQQSEAAALPSPRRLDPPGPMVWAIHPRYTPDDVAVILEDVEVSPGELLEVMGLAKTPALRAGELGSPVGGHLQVDLMRLFAGVNPLAHQPPRRLQSQAQGQKLSDVHEHLLLHPQRGQGIMPPEQPQFHLL